MPDSRNHLMTNEQLVAFTRDALQRVADACALPAPAAGEPELPDVDDLAQEIRRVDGNHSLGAGALAEALHPFIRAYGQAMAEHARCEALEEAALIIDAEEENAREERYHPGLVGALSACAAAIRAAAPPQGEPK